MRGNQRCDQTTFAVADQADFRCGNFLAGFQIGEGGIGVARKIFRRSIAVIASGLAVSALIETKNGNAFSGKVVGQDQKRAMPSERFIAVVRPGTTEENGGGKRARA